MYLQYFPEEKRNNQACLTPGCQNINQAWPLKIPILLYQKPKITSTLTLHFFKIKTVAKGPT